MAKRLSSSAQLARKGADSLSSAYLGGHLVFSEQIGVDQTAALELTRIRDGRIEVRAARR